jgi:N-acetylglucosamine kinase-like BadF-type ATPase
MSGPTNVQAVGVEAATGNLDRAVDAAFEDAGTARGPVAAAVLGLAGSDREEPRQIIRGWAEDRRLARRFRVVNDALPVLAAGTPEGWGVALICGTGSFCFGQARDGPSARSGGWGYLFGDEGSGYDLAVAGLRAAAKSADDRGPHTALLPEFLHRLNLTDPAKLIPHIYPMASDRAAIASLADVVISMAGQQDNVAVQITDHAAGELAAMTVAVVRKLDFPATGFPLALSGGLLVGNAILRNRFQDRLGTLGLQPDPLASVPDPVAGAVQLALAELRE